MKNCRKCEVELVVGGNWLASLAKTNRRICRSCRSKKGREWRKANPGAVAEHNREYYQANKDRMDEYNREWHRANPGNRREYRRAHYLANKEVAAEHNREYRLANLGLYAANQAKRRALIKHQTPSWYCHWMVVEIYEIAAEMGYEVDHIQPLSKGGLHSHENLQLLTREENRTKGAREHG